MPAELCQARPGADQQTRCAACRLVWDTNDPEPPVCGKERAKLAQDGADAMVYALQGQYRFVSGLPAPVR